MIKKIVKKTLIYRIYFKIKIILKIFFNRNFVKFKDDEKYSSQSLSKIFQSIYANKEWGDAKKLGYLQNDNLFFSGTGSYTSASREYIDFIINYIIEKKIKVVVDLGCGDFNIGKQIVEHLPNIKYIGVDIFHEIIDYNNKYFSRDNVSFMMVNTIENLIPCGDLLLVREVFQHLSNESISKIVSLQFSSFEEILITECHPPIEYLKSYNLDKPDGPGYRGDHGSGVFLDKPPFSLNITEVFSTNHEYFGEIKTFKINKNLP
jgi:tRNA G46 methylase TrmB